MRRLNQQFKYDFAESATELQSNVRLSFNIWFRSRISQVPNIMLNNSLDVICALEEKQLSLNYVSTWDISTLYTSLPHAQLKKQLHDLLERVFYTKGKSFIATNNFRTFWANDKTSTRYTYFSCRELGLATDFLIDNIYVRFGSSVCLLWIEMH